MTENEKPLPMRAFLKKAEKIINEETSLGLLPPNPADITRLSLSARQSHLLARITELGNQANMAYAAAAESDHFAQTILAEKIGELICSVLNVADINPLSLTLQQRTEISRILAELEIKEPDVLIDKKIEGYLI